MKLQNVVASSRLKQLEIVTVRHNHMNDLTNVGSIDESTSGRCWYVFYFVRL